MIRLYEAHAPLPSRRGRILIVSALLIVYMVAVVQTAWLSDDSYITFRTANNFVNGYGLTWNTDERVQTFTDPLWLMVITAAHAITREIFFTALAVSAGVSLAAMALVGFGAARTTIPAVIGVGALTLSRAYIDYSTSGLENPLSHLLLALFLIMALRADPPTLKTVRWLALIAGLAAVNRIDSVLIYIPALALAAYRTRSWRSAGTVVTGFAPLAAWEIFSIFYYGFPFPNTAYAKLNNGLDPLELIGQGIHYLQESLAVDPLTLIFITAGAVALVITARRRRDGMYVAVAGGMALYVAYVIAIGGDFMSGRMLTLPLLAGVVGLARIDFRPPGQWRWGLIALAGLGFLSPVPRFVIDTDGTLREPLQYYGDVTTPGRWGIADERRYYACASLWEASLAPEAINPDCLAVAYGKADRVEGRPVRLGWDVGFYGTFVGPHVHVIDRMALGDALLARLKPVPTEFWRIGHFIRPIPAGYVLTWVSGRNRIQNAPLAAYYDHLSVVTRGDLFDPDRLLEIWRFNTGQYNYLLADFNAK